MCCTCVDMQSNLKFYMYKIIIFRAKVQWVFQMFSVGSRWRLFMLCSASESSGLSVLRGRSSYRAGCAAVGAAPSSAWWQGSEEVIGGVFADGRGSACTASLENVLCGEEGGADDPHLCAYRACCWSGCCPQHLCRMWWGWVEVGWLCREWRHCRAFLAMLVVLRDQVRSSAMVTPRSSRHCGSMAEQWLIYPEPATISFVDSTITDRLLSWHHQTRCFSTSLWPFIVADEAHYYEKVQNPVAERGGEDINRVITR